MARKDDLQAEATALGITFTSRATIADLEALIAEAIAEAVGTSDLTPIEVRCPFPNMTVPLSPYLVRRPAADGSGVVTEPGPTKRISFDDDGHAWVEKAAWEAFTKNGAHNSYGIREVV